MCRLSWLTLLVCMRQRTWWRVWAFSAPCRQLPRPNSLCGWQMPPMLPPQISSNNMRCLPALAYTLSSIYVFTVISSPSSTWRTLADTNAPEHVFVSHWCLLIMLQAAHHLLLLLCMDQRNWTAKKPALILVPNWQLHHPRPLLVSINIFGSFSEAQSWACDKQTWSTPTKTCMPFTWRMCFFCQIRNRCHADSLRDLAVLYRDCQGLNQVNECSMQPNCSSRRCHCWTSCSMYLLRQEALPRQCCLPAFATSPRSLWPTNSM